MKFKFNEMWLKFWIQFDFNPIIELNWNLNSMKYDWKSWIELKFEFNEIWLKILNWIEILNSMRFD